MKNVILSFCLLVSISTQANADIAQPIGDVQINDIVVSSDLESAEKGFPIHEFYSSANKPFVFFISGDGGWTTFAESFALALQKEGYSVVGLDAQKYFWSKKTPAQTTKDFQKLINIYQEKWKHKEVILVGFSFGANVVPFVGNLLPADIKSKINEIIMFSPNKTGDFEIHLADMLNLGKEGKYNVLAEAKKIKDANLTCVFGQDEDEVDIQGFKNEGVRVKILYGSHHYEENYKGMVAIINERLK
jgi:type IV secretory pathway VirJ component